MWVVSLAIFCSALLACSFLDEPRQAPDAGVDAYCVVDCQSWAYCDDGVVSYSAGADTSGANCDWSVCPSPQSYTCAQGCDLEVNLDGHLGSVDLAAFCAETPAHHLGDPCETTCLPTRGELQPDGTVTQDYLMCDSASHTCVAVDPPVWDWTQPCMLPMTWEPGFHGIVVGDYGWCIVDDEPDAGCSRAAPSHDCVGDWECPVGATCEPLREQNVGVCRPGARGTEIDLGC